MPLSGRQSGCPETSDSCRGFSHQPSRPVFHNNDNLRHLLDSSVQRSSSSAQPSAMSATLGYLFCFDSAAWFSSDAGMSGCHQYPLASRSTGKAVSGSGRLCGHGESARQCCEFKVLMGSRRQAPYYKKRERCKNKTTGVRCTGFPCMPKKRIRL